MLNSPKSQLLGAEPVMLARATHRAKRLGDMLLDRGAVTPGDLAKALHMQRFEEAHLGEILVSMGAVNKNTLWDTLAEQNNVPRAPVLISKPKDNLTELASHQDLFRLSFAPFAKDRDHISIAFSDPETREEIERYFWAQDLIPHLYLSDRTSIQTQIARLKSTELIDSAETACPAHQSCRGIELRLALAISVVTILTFLSLSFFLGYFAEILIAFGALVFFALSSLKFASLVAYLPKSPEDTARRSTRKLEKVTLMVPLFKESQIAKRLIPRLQKISYPSELLEIFLICEEGDFETIDAVSASNLPINFHKISVPKGSCQTKPRALNYALPFASGSIIAIYDAEDAPEADQVFKAVRHLQTADLRVCCVQARLDFYNETRNWLTRCFTLEYAILFRVFLRGLQRLDLPIPLGGTSMFIRREALEEIGSWDAHNVTEDADLGMRLYRAGYRVECLDSTTFEEANFRLLPWIKQRSRWLKGFFLTWASHMRNPVALLENMGWSPFLALNLLFLATFTGYLLLPIFLPLWALYLGFVAPEALGIPQSYAAILFLLLIFGEPYYLVAGMLATKDKRLRKLRLFLPSLIFYWPLASIAAYKALYEALFHPFYWDKTEHGLDDETHHPRINALTNQAKPKI